MSIMESNNKEFMEHKRHYTQKLTSNATHVVNRFEMPELGPWGDITELAQRCSEPVNPTFLVVLEAGDQ